LREDTTDRHNEKRTTPNSPKANKITNKQQSPSTKSCRPEQHQHHTKNSFKQKSEQKEIQPTTHNSNKIKLKINNSNNKSLTTELARRQKGKLVQETKGGKKTHTPERACLLACLLLTHKLLQIL
jgi:hypothetical protein